MFKYDKTKKNYFIDRHTYTGSAKETRGREYLRFDITDISESLLPPLVDIPPLR